MSSFVCVRIFLLVSLLSASATASLPVASKNLRNLQETVPSASPVVLIGTKSPTIVVGTQSPTVVSTSSPSVLPTTAAPTIIPTASPTAAFSTNYAIVQVKTLCLYRNHVQIIICSYTDVILNIYLCIEKYMNK